MSVDRRSLESEQVVRSEAGAAGLSFGVSPGDVIGVLGKNGAGKTTLLELMLGFTPPTAGAVRVFGHESYSLPGRHQGARRLRAPAGRIAGSAHVADQLRVIASFYPHWDSDAHRRGCAVNGASIAGAHQDHVGGRAAEVVDPAGVRPQTGAPDPR